MHNTEREMNGPASFCSRLFQPQVSVYKPMHTFIFSIPSFILKAMMPHFLCIPDSLRAS